MKTVDSARKFENTMISLNNGTKYQRSKLERSPVVQFESNVNTGLFDANGFYSNKAQISNKHEMFSQWEIQ